MRHGGNNILTFVPGLLQHGSNLEFEQELRPRGRGEEDRGAVRLPRPRRRPRSRPTGRRGRRRSGGGTRGRSSEKNEERCARREKRDGDSNETHTTRNFSCDVLPHGVVPHGVVIQIIARRPVKRRPSVDVERYAISVQFSRAAMQLFKNDKKMRVRTYPARTCVPAPSSGVERKSVPMKIPKICVR